MNALAAGAMRRRVLRWVIPTRDTVEIGPGPVVHATIENGFVVLYTEELDPTPIGDIPVDVEPSVSVRAFRTGVLVPAGARHLISVGAELNQVRHVYRLP